MFAVAHLEPSLVNNFLNDLDTPIASTSKSNLLTLATNPYFLMMFVYIYGKLRKLPSNKGMLLQSFIEQLYTRELELDTSKELELEQLLDVLGKFALQMQIMGRLSSKMSLSWAERFFPLSLSSSAEKIWFLAREMGLIVISTGNN